MCIIGNWNPYYPPLQAYLRIETHRPAVALLILPAMGHSELLQRLLLEPSKGNALDELFLGDKEDDENGERGYCGTSHELSPVDTSLFLEHGESILERPDLDSVRHDEWPEIVVPAPHEGENGKGCQYGLGQGEHNSD